MPPQKICQKERGPVDHKENQAPKPHLGNQESYQFNIPFEFNARTKPLSKLPDSISVFPFSALDLSSLIAFLTVLWFVDPAILKGKGRVRRSPTRGSSSTGKTVFPEWKKWMVVITLSIILPSYRHKWGPLVSFEVDETIETVETVTDITEDLGEDVEKVAEALENKIPDQEAKLKEAVEQLTV
ncbi:hypothetical protein CK203_113881 [Vitis vinifera]|uniref:Uncharacterized protein n=1 Tax=Vitis vinifera TaxID=29760 RepID=A0A438FCW8_VITVI|nr:hypothetical protein CK203_113881 [Vitis vinifera]